MSGLSLALMNLAIKIYKLLLEETGTPAGWYPLIIGYDTLPTLPADLDLPSLPQELLDYLATHERINPR